MKKALSIVICAIGLLSLTACGSSRPCGLADKSKQVKQYNQQEILVSEVTE